MGNFEESVKSEIYTCISGGIWPLGIPISMSWLDLGAILALVHEHKIETFVEIGVHRGGLASIIITRSRYQNLKYFGIEIDRNWFDPTFVKLMKENSQANVLVADAFSYDGKVFIWNALNNKDSGKSLLLCDGGGKALEVQTFCHYLKVNDIMIAHDYKIEITDNDLSLLPRWVKRFETEYSSATNLVMYRREW